MKKIVVNGLCESAGKTTTALALFSNLQKIEEVALFKPLAGNNYWYDYSVVNEGLREGRLYGEDAKLLSKYSGVKEEIINPFHRLWVPSSIAGNLETRGEDLVLFDRIYDGDKTYLLINSQVNLPEAFSELLNGADVVEKYSGMEEHNEYVGSLYTSSFQNSFSHMKEADLLIIESYSDVSLPFQINGIDLVVTVEPGIAHISDGRKFKEANSMVRGIYRDYGFEETKTEKILDLVNSENHPIKPIDIGKTEVEKGYQELLKAVRDRI